MVSNNQRGWGVASASQLIESFTQDSRYALRSLARKPLFAVAVVLTLAIGIGATTAVFSAVDRILFRSLPYAQPQRLVTTWQWDGEEASVFATQGIFVP